MTRSIHSILFPFIVLALPASLLFSCNSVYTPRPRGYYKIGFPARQYRSFDQPGYPYTFEYPVYANITRDTSFAVLGQGADAVPELVRVLDELGILS